MKGFMVTFTDISGKEDVTFFGQPLLSPGLSLDMENAIQMIFHLSHPFDTLVSIRACTLEEFLNRGASHD